MPAISDDHPARSDCERVKPRIGQPVNTLTSLVITAVGVGLARRSKAVRQSRSGARWAGWALAAAGIGSAVYHGPGGRMAPWLHDVTLLAPPVVLALASEHDRRNLADVALIPAIGAALAGAGAVRAISPGSQDGLSAITAAAVLAATWQRIQADHTPHDWRALAAAAATGAAGVGVHALSRTDGPLCKPDSVMQGHGLWHLLAAAATVIASKGLGFHEESWART